MLKDHSPFNVSTVLIPIVATLSIRGDDDDNGDDDDKRQYLNGTAHIASMRWHENITVLGDYIINGCKKGSFLGKWLQFPR